MFLVLNSCAIYIYTLYNSYCIYIYIMHTYIHTYILYIYIYKCAHIMFIPICPSALWGIDIEFSMSVWLARSGQSIKRGRLFPSKRSESRDSRYHPVSWVSSWVFMHCRESFRTCDMLMWARMGSNCLDTTGKVTSCHQAESVAELALLRAQRHAREAGIRKDHFGFRSALIKKWKRENNENISETAEERK